jgi:hypothetical protein
LYEVYECGILIGFRFGCIVSDTSLGISRTFAITYDSLVGSRGFFAITYFAGNPLISVRVSIASFVVVIVIVILFLFISFILPFIIKSFQFYNYTILENIKYKIINNKNILKIKYIIIL